MINIRGFNTEISDLGFEDEPIETLMWNPIHYAIYHGHINILKYLVEEV